VVCEGRLKCGVIAMTMLISTIPGYLDRASVRLISTT
jgi:hypothetical protein